jgi:hypothetical protein
MCLALAALLVLHLLAVLAVRQPAAMSISRVAQEVGRLIT